MPVGCGRSREERPSADSMSQRASSPVWLRTSWVGLSSTISMPTSWPVWAAISQRRWDSRRLMPPGTGVPTPGACRGSTPSRSKLRWMPEVCRCTWAKASRRHTAVPRASSSDIVKTRTPSSCTRVVSVGSTSRTPMMATSAGSRAGPWGHSAVVSSGGPRPSRQASGIPWMLPDGEVALVFMSVWASTQMTPSRSPRPWNLREIPEMVPIAMEWSPPSTSGNVPSADTASTRSASRVTTRAISGRKRRLPGPGSRASKLGEPMLSMSSIR